MNALKPVGARRGPATVTDTEKMVAGRLNMLDVWEHWLRAVQGGTTSFHSIIDRSEPRSTTSFHVSTQCNRQAVLIRSGAEKAPDTLSSLDAFTMGWEVEGMVCAALKYGEAHFGYTVEFQGGVNDAERQITGRWDALVTWADGFTVLLDVKSTKLSSLRYKVTRPDEGYRAQLCRYVALEERPINAAAIIYKCKEVAVFHVDNFDPKDGYGDFMLWKRGLYAAWEAFGKDGSLPPELEPDEQDKARGNKMSWRCRYCSFTSHCPGVSKLLAEANNGTKNAE